MAAVIWSVIVGTRTSTSRIASTMSAWDIGLSSTLRRASNNSRMRVSTSSGSRRVTISRGLGRSSAPLLPPARRRRRRPCWCNHLFRAFTKSSRRVNGRRRWIGRRGDEFRTRRVGLLSRRAGKDKDGRVSVEEDGMKRDGRPFPALAIHRRGVLALLSALVAAPRAAIADPVGPVTKLPLPRFASLKTDRVNLREGPSRTTRPNGSTSGPGFPSKSLPSSKFGAGPRFARG